MPITGLDDLNRLSRWVGKTLDFAGVDMNPLIKDWEKILAEDNVRRAMVGLDCNDRPMTTTQRELSPAKSRRTGSGPPLAPHGMSSRIVTAARTRGSYNRGRGYAELGWDSFDSRSGQPILPFHQHGIPSRSGPIVRDVMSHPSPTALRKCQEAVTKFVSKLLSFRL